MFGDLRAVVVDEVHAFAGDDRGWHLLAVLERVGVIAGRPLQRVGLSATVGQPGRAVGVVAGWCSRAVPPSVGRRAGCRGIGPPGPVPRLRGKRRQRGEGAHLHTPRREAPGLRRHAPHASSHSRFASGRTRSTPSCRTRRWPSTSAGEQRRRSREARDCVIVSTSTLELGIDVGDLDRVIQLGAPTTVASVLQRLGRTGRRPGTGRNLTFLATADDELLRAAALLLLLEEGFVEPVVAPPEPRHIAAQQLLGVALQKGRISLGEEAGWIRDLGLAGAQDLREIARWLVDTGHVDLDDGLAFVGPAAEQRYGRRIFRDSAGRVHDGAGGPGRRGPSGNRQHRPDGADREGDRAENHRPGRSHLAGHPRGLASPSGIRRAQRAGGTSRWSGEPRPFSFELANAMRRVLLGAMPVRAALDVPGDRAPGSSARGVLRSGGRATDGRGRRG